MEVAVNKCPHNGCFIWIQIILIPTWISYFPEKLCG